MKKAFLVILAAALSLLLLGLIAKAKFFSKPDTGGLQVMSVPKSTVFVDDVQMGETPFFKNDILIGERTVKVVPQAAEGDLVPWEGRVLVTANIMTVINRDLASSEASSAGDILSLERIADKNSSALAVVAVPDQSVVSIDDDPEGFAPVLVEDLAPGNYQVSVSSQGYQERVIAANTVAGYKLTVNVRLAQEVEGIEEETAATEEAEEEESSSTPSPEPSAETGPALPDKPYVEIKQTSTGWLRVRAKPSTSSEELSKVNPGDTFPFLEEENGWYKIEYQDDEEGWVSGTFADLFE